MSEPSGWRPLSKQRRGRAIAADASAFVMTPFGKLARTHTISTMGDGAVTLALAGSIFFSVSPTDARLRVAGYLLLTMAPFAVVTPLIGPVIDRMSGGRRTVMVTTLFGRGVLAFLMVGHIDSLLLFPEAFGVLVLQKAYAVSKSAVVPAIVADEDGLVDANSKLALLAAIGSMSGAAFAGLLVIIGGPAWAAAVAVVVFAIAGVSALRVPSAVVAPAPMAEMEKAELRSVSIILSGSAMGVLRGIVGFVTFLLAFEFRGGEDGISLSEEGAALGVGGAVARGVDVLGEAGAPAWHFGVVIAMAGVGVLLGARIAPQLRTRLREERILRGCLLATGIAGTVAALAGGLFGAVVCALAVSASAAAGKLVFDSIVQRDAPDANYGRSFARFEARFQVSWVIGAFVAVVSPVRSAQLGYILIAAAALSALVSYVIGTRTAAQRPLSVREVIGADTAEAPTPPADGQAPPSAPAAPTHPPGSWPPPEAEPEPVDDTWTQATAEPHISTGEGVEIDETR